MKFLKLIGFKNLIVLAFAQFTFKYGFLDYQPELTLALSDGKYALLVLACTLIAAGGFFINAVAGIGKTIETGMSEAKIYNIYIVLNILALGIGYYLADYIGRPSFMGIFVVGSATLYLYATSLKQTLLIGNALIAIIAALSIIVIGIFNLYPIISSYNQEQMALIFSLMLDYSLFTLLIIFMLTLVKDLKNTDADYNAGINTLPVIIGKKRTTRVLFTLGLIAIALLLYYTNAYLKSLLWLLGFGLVFILGPVIYFMINILSAKTYKEFATLEVLLKLVLFFTAASLAVMSFNIKHIH